MLSRTTRNTYASLLDAACLTPSDVPAVTFVATDADPIYWTRRDFAERVHRAAGQLAQFGIQPRDLVVIAHTHHLESMVLFWAALYLGAIPSMFPTLTEKLDPDIYAHNLSELVRLSEVKAVFAASDSADLLRGLLTCPVYSDSDLLTAPSVEVQSAQSQPTDVAFLQHSSGTTGLQKGVALSHQAVLNQLASYSDAIHLNERDVIVSWLPLYHDMGLIAGFLLPLVQGIPLVLMSPFDWVRHPALLLKAFAEHSGTLCWVPNFAYNHLANRVRERDSEDLDLSNIRAIINCSEPVRDDSHQRFLSRFEANGIRREMLAVSYAMAENTFAVTQTVPGQPPMVERVDLAALQQQKRTIPVEAGMPMVSCGPVIAGAQVRIVDDEKEPVPDRHVGHIQVKSDSMLNGYYKRPDLQPFTEDGWYETGDRGYLADGEVYVIGRTKDLIINAGKNVYPQDLEAVINEIEGVHAGRAVVFGVPDEREGTELIAVVAEVDSDDAVEH
ncbi:MAG: AMP-binding protein, partial [Anaerolineae bacterium]|nr:AMP-binding protein [Anaerolineae bacterium]